MTHYYPQRPKIFTLWPTMTRNFVNCFTMTQNKVLGHFVFLYVVPYIFWENFVPKLESALFNLKLDIKGVLGCWFWIPKLFPYFFSLEYLFRANMVAILKSALFRMKIRSKRYSQVLISNSTIVFLSSVPKIPFSGQIWSPNFKVLFWKWNSVQWSVQGCWFWF